MQIKRGKKVDLPSLKDGELGLCTDTNELYIGNNGNKNILLGNKLVNNLTTGGANNILSAEQGKILKEQLDDIENIATATYVLKNQGASNVGKILTVGSDGNLTLIEMPEAGGGDVVGTLDQSNNILLTGDLADGTYTLKYEYESGTVSEVGSIVISSVVTPTNQIPLSTDTDGTVYNDIGYKTNMRINSSGDAVSNNGSSVTGFMPAQTNDVVYMSGMYVTDSTGFTRLTTYDSSKTQINGNHFPSAYTNVSGDIYSFTIEDSNVAYIRLGVNKLMDGTEIVTINQPLS